MIFLGYHPDFGNNKSFARRTQLQQLARKFDSVAAFPQGRFWPPSFQDRDNRNRSEYELNRFDEITKGKEVVLTGYSRGASVANRIAVKRSDQVICLITYEGRLAVELSRWQTTRKFPVLALSNQRSKRRRTFQYQHMVDSFEMNGHSVFQLILQNRKTHWHGWHRASANHRIEDFVKHTLERTSK